MRKLWMKCAVAVITCTLAAWVPRSTDSSQHLLAKAQSEFAEKARDSVYKRGIVPSVSQHVTATAMGSVAVPDHALAPPAESRIPVQVASEAGLPVTQALASNRTVADLPVASTGSDKVITVAASAVAPDAVVTAVNENANEQSDSVSPKQVASVVAAVQPLVREEAILPAVSPLARRKTVPTKIARYALRQPAGRKRLRHSEPNTSAVRRSMNMLRAHAPEIAALVARYM